MKTIYRLQSVTGIMSTHIFHTSEEAQVKADFLNNLTNYKWHVVKLLIKEAN